ncbi:MAG: DUF2892 domain-containing protein [Paludibacter sp.]|nr:DUF2892 domain-containing protein [Paludibacter sp.]
MKSNVGTIDRVIRLLLAVVLVVLFFTNVVTGTLGYVLLALAGVLTLTSLISFCPLFLLFGISTAKKK